MTQAPPIPDTNEEEPPPVRGLGWFAIGALGGFVLVGAIAFTVLMGRTSTPDYTVDLVRERAVSAGDAVAELTLIGTEFAYDPMTSSIVAGGTLTLDNTGSVIHNIEIEGVAGFLIEADAGAEDSAVVDVDPGSYVIFCSIAGHREAGMEGTLNVVEG